MENFFQHLGLVAGFALPLFNIPLILHILKRKSSHDISLVWALGVWVCIVLMTPAALITQDMTFKVFGIMNIAFFSAVTLVTVIYRDKRKS